MRIGIIGGGVVGHATARAFMEHAEVRVFDLVAERRTHGIFEVLDCDIVFVCLPTPQKSNSLECDSSAIDKFFDYILHHQNWHAVNFVLRSTVPIGTTRNLREKYNLPNLVHSPEFLTARCAITDAQIPSRNIIGIPPAAGCRNGCLDTLITLYSDRFTGVQIRYMTSDESEAVKIGLNSFFAVKLAYFNELRAVCDRLGLNWDSVRAGILSDGRIAHSHTQVPGPDGKRGFGGTCLPKDLANLIHCMDGSDLLMAARYWSQTMKPAIDMEDRHGQDDLRGCAETGCEARQEHRPGVD